LIFYDIAAAAHLMIFVHWNPSLKIVYWTGL
jgi:uncharacterized protein YfaT (DUF1175 family)